MHQIKKGSEWYFGMKVHASADASSGYVHIITGTSVNMHDVSETLKLLREDDHVMYGDSGYFCAPEHPEIKEDEVLSKIVICPVQNRACFPHSQKSDGLSEKELIVESKKHEWIQHIIYQCQPSYV